MALSSKVYICIAFAFAVSTAMEKTQVALGIAELFAAISEHPRRGEGRGGGALARHPTRHPSTLFRAGRPRHHFHAHPTPVPWETLKRHPAVARAPWRPLKPPQTPPNPPGRHIGGQTAALTSMYCVTALLSELLTNNAAAAIMWVAG